MKVFYCKFILVLFVSVLAFSPYTSKAAGELYLYNWFDYMDPDLLKKFSDEYDIKVTQDTYDSNETLLARLKAGVTGYDVAVPGDYMVAILVQEGLLERSNPNELPNFKNVRKEWVDVYFDPGRHYSIPYHWGTTSFMVDTSVYDEDIDSLSIIFSPPPKLRGKINMLKDVNDVINMALRYLDYPRCNDNPAQLQQVDNLLRQSKKYWLSFNSDGAKEVLVSGDASAGMIWNGFGMRARLERPTLKYSYPREGLTAWMDNFVILKDAPNFENALKFLNFMMDPKNAATAQNHNKYATGLMGTSEYVEVLVRNAPEINPPRGSPTPEFVPPCAEEVIRSYDRIWTNLLK